MSTISPTPIYSLGSATHHQDGIGNVPINIITTGGQTYAVASNLQAGVPSQNSVPAQMQIRSIAPNAATVVNQLQTNQVAVQQVRGNIQQQRLQNIGKTNRFPDGKCVYLYDLFIWFICYPLFLRHL